MNHWQCTRNPNNEMPSLNFMVTPETTTCHVLQEQLQLSTMQPKSDPTKNATNNYWLHLQLPNISPESDLQLTNLQV